MRSAKSVCGRLQKHQLWGHWFLFPTIFRALYDYEGLKRVFSNLQYLCDAMSNYFVTSRYVYWLLINTWPKNKNKKIEISIHLTFKNSFASTGKVNVFGDNVLFCHRNGSVFVFIERVKWNTLLKCLKYLA